jgi:hypothetical protein
MWESIFLAAAPMFYQLARVALSLQARPNVMKGPWHRQGKGVRIVTAPAADEIPRRIQYRFCRRTVQPPSDFRRNDVPRSAQVWLTDSLLLLLLLLLLLRSLVSPACTGV